MLGLGFKVEGRLVLVWGSNGEGNMEKRMEHEMEAAII